MLDDLLDTGRSGFRTASGGDVGADLHQSGSGALQALPRPGLPAASRICEGDRVSEDGREGDVPVVVVVRDLIDSRGVASLTIDDLTVADLPSIAWSGSRSHVQSVAKQLARVTTGDVDYLAVRAPKGEPVATGGVSYAMEPGVGMIWQLATRQGLRGLGIGTLLIEELERRIVRRGRRFAMLSVDQANPRPQALYERLGYRVVGERVSGWEVTRPDGSRGWYEARLTDLRKELPSA